MPVVFCFRKSEIIMDTNTLFKILQNAVAQMYHDDPSIATVAKLEDNCAAVIKANMRALCENLGDFSIDFNYSHMMSPDGKHCAKKVPMGDGNIQSVKPDLVFHVRDKNENNLMAIEIKGWWENDDKRWIKDEQKLCGYTDQSASNALKYSLGVFIALGKHEGHFVCFQAGHHVSTGDSVMDLYDKRSKL